MSDLTSIRLSQEYKLWKKNHPFGFIAKPSKNTDGSLNLRVWECYIPGPRNTLWEGAFYFLRMYFKDFYPLNPPKCVFYPPLLHPNIYTNGNISLSILDEQRGWRPAITIKMVLLEIHALLNNPNIQDPTNDEAYMLYRYNRKEYNRRIICQTREICERSV